MLVERVSEILLANLFETATGYVEASATDIALLLGRRHGYFVPIWLVLNSMRSGSSLKIFHLRISGLQVD